MAPVGRLASRAQRLDRDSPGSMAAAATERPRRRGRPSRPFVDSDIALPEWDALAESSGNVFATREWLSVWWRHFGVDEPVVARAYESSGRLLAIMPLYLWLR